MRWGKRGAPRLTLVGKGVAFDTGGLDIKPPSGMRNMKKDMGGAANVLALAGLIVDMKLNVRLRVLIPAVENSIAGNAFRPGDIFPSRKGLTVEIGNTDAEGRLVLADALTLADEEKPDLIIDMATLTGAARVALGPDLPPFYTTDEDFASALADPPLARARSALAHAALGALTEKACLARRRSLQHHLGRHGRLGDGGAVPAAFRHRGQGLGPSRYLRMEPGRQAARAGRRRGAGHPRPARRAEAPLRRFLTAPLILRYRRFRAYCAGPETKS
jgi:hypothetical protein